MADHIMRAVNQLMAVVPADGDESIIAVDDFAFKVSSGDQALLGTKPSVPAV
jgi:hypothetical protein